MQTYTYEQARSFIKDGDIIFFKDKPNLASKVIDYVTNSHFSHVAIAFWISVECSNARKIKRLMIVQSSGTANNRTIINLSNNCMDDMIVVSSPMNWIDISESALDRVGLVPYGWIEGTKIGVRYIISKITGKQITPTSSALTREVCSQFVARIYGLKTTQISPQELYDELLSKHNCEVKFEILPLSTDIKL